MKILKSDTLQRKQTANYRTAGFIRGAKKRIQRWWKVRNAPNMRQRIKYDVESLRRLTARPRRTQILITCVGLWIALGLFIGGLILERMR